MDSSEEQAKHPSRPVGGTVVGVLIAIYATFDTLLVGLPILALATWGKPLVVFAAASAAITVINLAACAWLTRRWDGWIAGPGRRVEGRLEKMRAGRIMSHPISWVTRGSDRWFAFAATLINAIGVVVAARALGGKPVSDRRIRIASVSYALFFSGTYALVGWVLSVVILSA